MADKDLERREGGRLIFFLALPAFLPSESFFTQNKGEGSLGRLPLDPRLILGKERMVLNSTKKEHSRCKVRFILKII